MKGVIYAVFNHSLGRPGYAGEADGGPAPPPGEHFPGEGQDPLRRRAPGRGGKDEGLGPDHRFRRP